MNVFKNFIFQEIIGIIQILDPEGKGKINFEDFCKGVQQILDIHSPSSPGKYIIIFKHNRSF